MKLLRYEPENGLLSLVDYKYEDIINGKNAVIIKNKECLDSWKSWFSEKGSKSVVFLSTEDEIDSSFDLIFVVDDITLNESTYSKINHGRVIYFEWNRGMFIDDKKVMAS
jgi:hypothetical protein